MPSLSRVRRRVDTRAVEAARRAKRRASWDQMKSAVAAKYESEGKA